MSKDPILHMTPVIPKGGGAHCRCGSCGCCDELDPPPLGGSNSLEGSILDGFDSSAARKIPLGRRGEII